MKTTIIIILGILFIPLIVNAQISVPSLGTTQSTYDSTLYEYTWINYTQWVFFLLFITTVLGLIYSIILKILNSVKIKKINLKNNNQKNNEIFLEYKNEHEKLLKQKKKYIKLLITFLVSAISLLVIWYIILYLYSDSIPSIDTY